MGDLDLIQFKVLIEDIIKTYGWHAVWIIPLGLLLYGIILPEKLEKWSSWFYRLFSWTSSYFQRRFIATDIQSRVNSGVKSINSELPGAIPYGIKIHWIKTKEIDRDGFIKGNNIVVLMKRHTNQDRNFVLATLVYSSLGVIAEARNYVFPKISKALDLSITRKILISKGRRSALGYFIKNILQTEKDKDGELKEYLEVMQSLDDAGIFTRVFMAELLDLSIQLFPKLLGDPNILFETHNFLFFCRKIAQRKIGEEIELDFNNQGRIRISVIMIAKALKREFFGIDTYIKRFKKCVNNGSIFIYFIGWKNINIDFLKRVIEKVVELKLGTKISESIFWSFVGSRSSKTTCVKIKV